MVDQLIMSLGLGGSGQHIAPAGAPGVPGAPFPVGGVANASWWRT